MPAQKHLCSFGEAGVVAILRLLVFLVADRGSFLRTVLTLV